VDYGLTSGNGQQQFIRIFFDDSSSSATSQINWFRTKDTAGGGPAAGEDVSSFVDAGIASPNALDLPLTPETHYVQIIRAGQEVSVLRSADGLIWNPFLSHTFTDPLGGEQVLHISGLQFRAGQFGIADYDYISVTSTVPEPGAFVLASAGITLIICLRARRRDKTCRSQAARSGTSL
jgi:hypothetical protein